jgi:endoglucanase
MKNRGKRTVPVCIALTGGKARTLHVLLSRLTFAIFFVAVAPRPGPAQEAVWSVFKQNFMTGEGRVVDDANNDISHSEGQGYGLILSEANKDRESFQRIWKWTEQNLRKRNDHLFAWRWVSNSVEGHVPDTNNATDGDLLIAWGLARGASAWADPGLRDSARDIARDVRQEMLRPSRYGPVLLPGEHGFDRSDGIIINLSYWVFPAFRDLSKIDPSPDWQLLEQSGLKLVEAVRFSPWRLPPDWLLLGPDSMKLPDGFEPVFGYNAVRVPLYLAWAGIEPAAYYAPFRQLSAFSLYPEYYTATREGSSYLLYPHRPPVPAKVALPSGKAVNLPSTNEVERALPGMVAIYELVSSVGDFCPPELLPYGPVSSEETYYSVSLGLLSNCACLEWRGNRP